MSSELPCISMNLIELRPVVLGQPVGRLDLAATLDVREKCLLIAWNLDSCHGASGTERSLG